MFAVLQNFRLENGHANVPQNFSTNRKLGWWVATQRRDRRNGKTGFNQIAQLMRIVLTGSPQSGGDDSR